MRKVVPASGAFAMRPGKPTAFVTHSSFNRSAWIHARNVRVTRIPETAEPEVTAGRQGKTRQERHYDVSEKQPTPLLRLSAADLGLFCADDVKGAFVTLAAVWRGRRCGTSGSAS